MKRVTVKATIVSILVTCGIILIAGDEDCASCYSQAGFIWKFFICGIVIIGISVFEALKYKEMDGIIFDIANQPLLETNEATAGVSFAGSGELYAEETAVSPYTKTPCIYYHSVTEKLVKSGKNRKWVVSENLCYYVPLYLKDERGTLAIDLRNVDEDHSRIPITLKRDGHNHSKYSEIDSEVIMKRKRGVKKDGKVNKNLRRSEYILRPKTTAFVYGYVEKEGGVEYLREHAEHPLIISRKTRKAFVKEFSKGKSIIYVSQFLVFVGFSIAMLAAAFWELLPVSTHLMLIGVAGLVTLLSLCFTLYNQLVLLKNRVLNAKSNIDGELKRRHSLIPQIVQVVQGYVRHEKVVQHMVAQLRSGAKKASVSNLHNEIAVVAEAYPDLKAAQSYQELMIHLVDTEERIAFSRSFYNGAVRSYATLKQQFPFVLVASVFHFPQYDYIEVKEEEKTPSDQAIAHLHSPS